MPLATTRGRRWRTLDRYARLRERGVDVVFLALPDLAGPGDLYRCAALVRAYA